MTFLSLLCVVQNKIVPNYESAQFKMANFKLRSTAEKMPARVNNRIVEV
jgi:hypothetical protein